MSDHSISIVAKLSSYPGNVHKAAEILDWLIAQDIVQPVATDCLLGSIPGYAVSAGARMDCFFTSKTGKVCGRRNASLHAPND